MVEFTRQKSLNQSYKRLVLNENDLVRIATIVQTLVDKFGHEIEIKIISGDGQETIRTSDPNFFTTPHIFPQIRSVSIVYYHFNTPVSCRIDISSNTDGKASVSVDGVERETVSGIFYELEREFKLRQSFGAKFSELLNNGASSFLISISAAALTAIAIYSVFDLMINLIASRSADFIGSPLQRILQTIGWICVLVGAIVGGDYLINLLNLALPGVEFSGRLSDTNSMNKTKVIWVFSVILLPIVINVFSNLITSIIGVK